MKFQTLEKKITSLITIQTIGLVQNILELDLLLILIMGKVEVGIFLTIQNIYRHKNNIIPSNEEKLTNYEKFNDYIMTSLRTIWVLI